MGFMHKIRTFMFPRIKDWKASHSEKKYRKDWWNMKNTEFIVFHQKGTKYFLFGVSLFGFIGSLLGGIFMFLRFGFGFSILLFVMAFMLGKSTFLKIKSWKTPTITFYELLLRDH